MVLQVYQAASASASAMEVEAFAMSIPAAEMARGQAWAQG